MTYTTRTTCRICGSTQLRHLFSLGDHYVNNFVPHGKAYDGEKCPIELVVCGKCTLVQNPHTAPQELLYSGHYWYKSGTTNTMRDALSDIVACAMRHVSLSRDDIVLDIGSNDGTLLRCYPEPLRTIGVEPASNMKEEGSKGIDLLVSDFWSFNSLVNGYSEKYSETIRLRPRAKIVTAIGMFYDLEDPNQFIADIKKVLHPEGVFIAQLMCLHNMLNVSDLGNLAHEHLEYYTLKSLEELLFRHGLEVFRIETNKVNGESYRLYIQHVGYYGRQIEASVPQYRFAEKDVLVRLSEFLSKMEVNKKKVVDFIRKENARGKKTWVYGASTKGNTILQYFGLNDGDIAGAAERDPDKWGKVTIGSNISITSEETARAVNPDYFLVLPYAFIDEFVERESEWRDKGGKFIVPLPEFRLI